MDDQRKRAAAFAEQLAALYGDDLVSVVLYGSAARGGFRQGASDLNLLVVLEKLDLERLQRATGTTRNWIAEGNPPPLMLSRSEWSGSADVFPLEYSDIKDGHVLLFGEDLFSTIRIDPEHLRLQTEHELRSKKIQLREGLLVTGPGQEADQLLVRSLSAFLTLFRAMLRLSGRNVPRDPSAVIEAVAALTRFRPAPVLEILRARDSSSDELPMLGDDIAGGYLTAIESAVTWLDTLEHHGTQREEL